VFDYLLKIEQKGEIMALIDIYVVDNSKSDIVMTIDQALTRNDVGVKDVADLAAYIARKCSSGDKIRELRIVGHGNTSGQYFGGDWVDSSTLRYYAADLRRIAKFFSSGGFVTLGGCKVGQNQILLGQLSLYFGVPVRAFTSSQNPTIPGDEGAEVKCFLLSCNKGKPTFLDHMEY
jgi:hypothetical protein